MADATLALFSSRLHLNRLDDSTLEILYRMLSSSKHVKEMHHLRTHLLQFLRSQSLTIIRQSADKPILHRLSTLDFFLRAFAILNDIQSCLSLRYEGLVLRDSSAATHPHFQVTCDEWLKFAQDAFQNAFYSVAAKACENAISCFDRNGDGDHDNLPEKMRSIDKIHRLKDAALQFSSNHSVQAHTAKYVKSKSMMVEQSSLSTEAECPASISFKNGIKLHNAQNLLRLKNQ